MKPAAYEQLVRLEQDHWWFRGRRHVYLGLLREALGAERPRRALDVGAGTGGFLGSLHALADDLHAAEPEPGAVAACAGRGFARCARAEATALPYADGSFDLVTMFDVLEHLDDDAEALAQVERVLSPGGLALISVPAHPVLWSQNDVVSGHVRRYRRRQLAGLLRDSGLHTLRLTYANAALFPPIALWLLACRAARGLGLARSPERTNLSWRLPPVADELAYRLFRAELTLSRRWDLPFGHSLVALVQRRSAAATALTPEPPRRRKERHEVRSGALGAAT